MRSLLKRAAESALLGRVRACMVDVGDYCIVGEGSVVANPVAAHAVVAGNPARQIGDRRDVCPPAGSAE